MDAWYLILMMVAIEPTSIEGRNYIPGDIVMTRMMATAETEADCRTGGELLAGRLEEIGGGTIEVIAVCELLPDHLEKAQEQKLGDPT